MNALIKILIAIALTVLERYGPMLSEQAIEALKKFLESFKKGDKMETKQLKKECIGIACPPKPKK